jgi:hypothetical protein
VSLGINVISRRYIGTADGRTEEPNGPEERKLAIIDWLNH